MNTPNTCGNRIRLLRTLHGLTLKQLGQDLHSSGSAIGRYERGERQPSHQLILSIARYFKVPVDYLVDETYRLEVEPLDYKLNRDLIAIYCAKKVSSFPPSKKEMAKKAIDAIAQAPENPQKN